MTLQHPVCTPLVAPRSTCRYCDKLVIDGINDALIQMLVVAGRGFKKCFAMRKKLPPDRKSTRLNSSHRP